MFACVYVTETDCPRAAAAALNQSEKAIFYVFALHARSDTNRLLMCVGAVAETFHHLMIITPPVSAHSYAVFPPL